MTEVYSIVIPTRERPDTLHHTLKTVCALPQQNVEIIVMDNFGTPATRNVVRRFEDSRIKYFRSKSRLSMSDNWECGLQHASGDYVFFLGDDDGILVDAVELAMIFHRWQPGKIIAWKPATWMWPNSIVRDFRNLMHMHLSQRVELRDSLSSLQRYYNCDTSFHELPGLYNAFVPNALIKEIIARHGRYFFSPIPDIYSGILNAYLTDQHIYSYRPLSVWGQSKHSTGLSYSYSFLKDQAVEKFIEENKSSWNQELDKALVESPLTEMALADTMIKAKEKFFPNDERVRLNMAGFVRSLCTAATRYGAVADQVVENILAVALKNNVSADQYAIPTDFAGPKRVINNYNMDLKHDLVCFDFYTDPSIYPAVDRVVKLVAEMSVSVNALPVVAEDVPSMAEREIVDERKGIPISDKTDARDPNGQSWRTTRERLAAASPREKVSWSLADSSTDQISVRKYRRQITLRKVARKLKGILSQN